MTLFFAMRVSLATMVAVFVIAGCSRKGNEGQAGDNRSTDVEVTSGESSDVRSHEDSKAHADSDRYRYFLDIKCPYDTTLGVTLNGYPVKTTAPTGATFVFKELTQAVENGTNHIEIATESGDLDFGEIVEVRISVRELRNPAVIVKALYEESYRLKKDSSAFKKELRFDVTTPFLWAWMSAENVGRLSQDDTRQILATVERVHSAWLKRDWDACLANYETCIKDQARFMGSSEDEVRASLRDVYRGLLSEPGATVVMQDASALVLTPYEKTVLVSPKDLSAPGVVWVRYPDRGSTRNRYSTIYGQIVFAKIGGEWRIVQ